MSPAELQRLREMSKDDIARRFATRLARRELTLKQYDTLIAYGKEKEISGAEAIAEAFGEQITNSNVYDERDVCSNISPEDGGNPTLREKTSHIETSGQIEASGSSLKAKILALLADKLPHTTKEIMEKVYGLTGDKGYANIHARITELRKDGHSIPKAKHVEGTIYSYQLT